MEPKSYKKPKFYYVYILLSEVDNKFYIGFTTNLQERFKSHQEGKNLATAPRRPFILIFYEAYLNKYDALRREKYLKTSKGKTTTNSMLKEYLKTTKCYQ